MNELVLIIEDNEKNLKLTRDLLQINGFRTIEAASAENGIPLAVEQIPDVVLLDVQLPGIDGIAAVAQFRGNPTTAAIPVVALTAYAMKGDRERLLAAGFDGYLSKPISVKTFADDVRQYIGVANRGL